MNQNTTTLRLLGLLLLDPHTSQANPAPQTRPLPRSPSMTQTSTTPLSPQDEKAIQTLS
ncbi:hypothetical protein [Vitiosangium sp. GDMCC 1.1324]|uniref:hypothetical protein n=1 Tax=Vitiosangium sp. (strain GDMCC 1.1324) TaxID=2138576 RepID=UPI00130E6817|nr:hypothetical protein [Vitiosangium sp. GDMCC 1.1324]